MKSFCINIAGTVMIIFIKISHLVTVMYESKPGSEVQFQVGSVLLRIGNINVS